MFLFWIAVGIVIKVLIPMPFLDDPIRAGWGWLRDKVRGLFK